MTRNHLWNLAAVAAMALAGASARAGNEDSAEASEPIQKASYAVPATAPCCPAPKSLSMPAKQYGHFVVENVKVNAMGVSVTIKRIKIMYKGDGIDADVAKCGLTGKYEAEVQGCGADCLDILKELQQAAQVNNEAANHGKCENKPRYCPPATTASCGTTCPAPTALVPVKCEMPPTTIMEPQPAPRSNRATNGDDRGAAKRGTAPEDSGEAK